MTAKVFKVICYVIAGFFIHIVSVLAFTRVQSTAIKAGMMVGFSVPGVCAILVGFALDRFRHKLRDTGIVLLSSAGYTAFLVLTFVCLLRDQEFRRLMKPDALSFFSDYGFGFGFMIAVALVGVVAIRVRSKRPNQPPEPTAMSVTPPAAQEPRQP